MTSGRVLFDARGLPGDPAFDVALGPVLLRCGLGDAEEIVWVHHPAPTAAFSRRDTRRPGFAGAAAAARRVGFTPVVRPQGGRLAAYHGGSVVVDHVVRTSDPHAGMQDRFRRYAEAYASVLGGLGADVRVGRVAGEYCPGDFSLNIGGTRKVAGAAQRVTRHGWLFSTVVQAAGGAVLREVLTAAYAELGYDLEPGTVGALEDAAPVGPRDVAAAVMSLYTAETPLPVVLPPAGLLAEVEAEAATRRVPPP